MSKDTEIILQGGTAVNAIEQQCTWKATGLNGHSDLFGSEFLYTSQEAPVEADEYERMKQRAETAEELAASYAETNTVQRRRIEELQAHVNAATQRAEAAERKLNDVLPQYVSQVADAIARAEAAEKQLAIAVRTVELADENTELRVDQLIQRAEAAEELAASYAETNTVQRRRMEKLQAHVNAATQRTKAAEAQLAATRTAIERYGADQWRRGNAGKDPQEFEEWQREQQ